MKPVIAVSDLHGQMLVLPKVKKIRHRFKDAPIVFDGDYQDSFHHHTGFSVAQEIMQWQQKDPEHVFALKGNHDEDAYESLTGKNSYWLEAGGDDVIAEAVLGATQAPGSLEEAIGMVKRDYAPLITWMGKLPTTLQIGKLVFVHAGLDLTLANPIKDTPEREKLWLREPYWYTAIYPHYAHNPLQKAIITGHTPTSLITGVYDGQAAAETLRNRSVSPRGILTVQYEGEYARFFIDGGNHSGPTINTGNIGVFDADTGRLIEAIEDDNR
ncbi:metallophosphoesterase [Levilactobacillus enshiensis]|uniref:metallophosphoesterase n=1 Tax=Levilactobacillus enshiensis TaxID=2590213 RepID=UPI00117BB1BD|nr:metallophosphoesterase [Levilactobacillus enshiensis]